MAFQVLSRALVPAHSLLAHPMEVPGTQTPCDEIDVCVGRLLSGEDPALLVSHFNGVE